jgi:hypothetical protein
MRLAAVLPNANYSHAGLAAYNSTSGRLFTLQFDRSGSRRLAVNKWNSVSSFNANIYNETGLPPTAQTGYFRLERDASNITAYFSPDGITWLQIAQEALGTFIESSGTIDYVGMLGNINNAGGYGPADLVDFYWIRKDWTPDFDPTA